MRDEENETELEKMQVGGRRLINKGASEHSVVGQRGSWLSIKKPSHRRATLLNLLMDSKSASGHDKDTTNGK